MTNEQKYFATPYGDNLVARCDNCSKPVFKCTCDEDEDEDEDDNYDNIERFERADAEKPDVKDLAQSGHLAARFQSLRPQHDDDRCQIGDIFV